MSLIWNNKDYKLVSEYSEWDRLEYVVSRKLHLQYTSTETTTIDLIKKSFNIYGAIEKIEIFRDSKTNSQFAHVTFKESRACYLALIDYKQNESGKIESMRPAYAHQQPDNSMDSTKSSFDALSDECVLRIFKNLDYLTIATLSVVCKRICQLIRENIFGTMCRFEGETSSETEVENTLSAANRIIQCIEPKPFHLKIYRDLTKSQRWPTIVIDFCYTEKSRLSIEMEFFKKKWLVKLEPTAKLIMAIHFRCTIYDEILPYKERDNVVWPNATMLIVSGYTVQNPIPDFSSVVASLPKLEDLFIRNLFFNLHMPDCCLGKHLRNIVFENCSFIEDRTEKMIWKVVKVVKQKQNHFPLCLKFDCIKFLKTEKFSECCSRDCVQFMQIFNEPLEQRRRKIVSWKESSYNIIKMIVRDENARKYVRIEIGDDSFSDRFACGSAHGGGKRCRADTDTQEDNKRTK